MRNASHVASSFAAVLAVAGCSASSASVLSESESDGLNSLLASSPRADGSSRRLGPGATVLNPGRSATANFGDGFVAFKIPNVQNRAQLQVLVETSDGDPSINLYGPLPASPTARDWAGAVGRIFNGQDGGTESAGFNVGDRGAGLYLALVEEVYGASGSFTIRVTADVPAPLTPRPEICVAVRRDYPTPNPGACSADQIACFAARGCNVAATTPEGRACLACASPIMEAFATQTDGETAQALGDLECCGRNNRCSGLSRSQCPACSAQHDAYLRLVNTTLSGNAEAVRTVDRRCGPHAERASIGDEASPVGELYARAEVPYDAEIDEHIEAAAETARSYRSAYDECEARRDCTASDESRYASGEYYARAAESGYSAYAADPTADQEMGGGWSVGD